MNLSSLVIPVLLAGVALYGMGKRVDVYGALTHGAEEGLTVLLKVLPALVGLLTAVAMFRASGALEWLTGLCAPALEFLGIPPETTPLMLVLILVELSDVIFAVDSIPAIFAVTTDPFIVLTSNLFAILGLRAMYFLLAGVAERFSMLKYGLAVILVFIGIKMLIVDFYHIPIAVSLSVVFGILVMTFIINAWVNYRHDKQRVE